ncbi:MAG: hypothetical protein JW928_04435 [Candidatus Aureabacteria bacterium]|nr:hypothetical protein [Candidatus Auribacterota bacterium]
MNILYGVQATGNGHICRSREVIKELRLLGHDVSVIFSGREEDDLWDVDDFSPYSVYQGLTFVSSCGRVQYWKTALQLNILRFVRDVISFDISNIDLVITDFEPISAYVAKKNKIPCMGIGHQYAFFYDVPFANKNLFSWLLFKTFAPVQIPLGLHWHHFDQPILPPIVPEMQEDKNVLIKNKILVYLPFEEPDDVKKLLWGCKDFDFYFYHHRFFHSDIHNLHLRSLSRTGFLHDLLDCSGVLCNAGFELPSEALFLRKKVLVIPLKGQFEQESNALALSCLGLGMTMKKLDKSTLEKWLRSSFDHHIHYPNVARNIAEWIHAEKWNDTSSLIETCWKNSS